jgi:ABC-2 type transport system ATP-binding protein
MYIECKDVSKKVKERMILKNINLNLEKGKIYGFRGHNGSGKTMLLRAIAGLMKLTTGSITIDGNKIGQEIPFPENMGLLIEYPGFIPDYTGYKNLLFLAMIKNKIDEKEIRASIQRVQLDPDDRRKYKKYSLGMKQKLGIAQAIMENPDLLLLDEPTNALDDKGVLMLKNLIIDMKKQRKTILITSHDKEFLQEVSDIIYTISEGEILNEKE